MFNFVIGKDAASVVNSGGAENVFRRHIQVQATVRKFKGDKIAVGGADAAGFLADERSDFTVLDRRGERHAVGKGSWPDQAINRPSVAQRIGGGRLQVNGCCQNFPIRSVPRLLTEPLHVAVVTEELFHAVGDFRFSAAENPVRLIGNVLAQRLI